MSVDMIARPMLDQPLKWHGGKAYLASRIVALMPPHTHYVEPFFGGGAVLLATNPEGRSEVVNDLNGWLTNFWNVLRDPELFPRLQRALEATPFSEPVFLAARAAIDSSPMPSGFDPVTAAGWFFVCCRQSLAGRMKAFAPFSRSRVRRGMNEQASAWLTSIEGLLPVHNRLIRVPVTCMPAMRLAQREDGPDTLQYWDPPYVPKSRTSPEVYAFEMTLDEHRELLDVARQCKGKVMLSGYACDLYDDALHDWTRHTFDLPNNAAGGDAKRRMTEVLWSNF